MRVNRILLMGASANIKENARLRTEVGVLRAEMVEARARIAKLEKALRDIDGHTAYSSHRAGLALKGDSP